MSFKFVSRFVVGNVVRKRVGAGVTEMAEFWTGQIEGTFTPFLVFFLPRMA